MFSVFAWPDICKHKRGWENSRQLCKPETESRVCITTTREKIKIHFTDQNVSSYNINLTMASLNWPIKTYFENLVIGNVACTTLCHTTMFTYSNANMPIGQSEHAYYLSYFINLDIIDDLDVTNNNYYLLSKKKMILLIFSFAFLWQQVGRTFKWSKEGCVPN